MAKKKYICTGCHKCTEPCTVELSGDADMTKDPNKMLHCGTWLEVPAEEDTNKEQHPKLTAEVFSLDDCPEWAQYAAVDANGFAYWYEDKPEQLITMWQSNERARRIGQDYAASDWKSSLIERPVKERLPKLTNTVFCLSECPEWAQYAAADADGAAYWYAAKPELGSLAWSNVSKHFLARRITLANMPIRYDIATWKSSLIERPTEQRTKLTHEVFAMPECPEWAQFAAVDSDGVAYWYDTKPEHVLGGWLGVGERHTSRLIARGNTKLFFDASDWKNSMIERRKKLTEEIFNHPECPADAVVAVVNAAGTAAWGTRANIVCDGISAFRTVDPSGYGVWTPIPGGACFDATDWQHSAVYKAGADPRCTEPAPLKLTHDVFSYSNPNGWTYVIRSQVEHGKTYARCPEWARYAAVDQSGAVCVYDTKPVLRSTDWYPDSGGRCAVVCNTEKWAVRFDITGWKNSLIERPKSECTPKLTPDVFSCSNLNGWTYVVRSREESCRVYDIGCPEWARYAAVNKSGAVYVYENKPVPLYTVWTDSGGRYAVVCTPDEQELKFDGTDWKSSLIERQPAEPRQKLTAGVFSLSECPAWARYAAVDHNGLAYWYDAVPYLNTDRLRWENSGNHAMKICYAGEVAVPLFDTTDWEHSCIDRPLPKLTVDVFSLPDCPIWARYAAVDADGDAYWYDKEPPLRAATWSSIGANHVKQITHGNTKLRYDSSDWEHSLIERPATVPDWFKPGVLAYNSYTHTFLHVTDSTEYHEKYLEAKVRPYNDNELESLFGQSVLGPKNSRLLVTGFRPEGDISGKPEICVLCGWLTAEELLTYGSKRQGIQQYHSKEGTWIDCGLSS